MLTALRAVHDAGVVHHDVKPSNVLLDRQGHAVLTDFGIATTTDAPEAPSRALLQGSPSYMPPERARGERCGPAGDLWSLGAMLFTLVQGEAPYARGDEIATVRALLSEPVPQATRGGALAPLIAALLSPDPDDRPGAAATLWLGNWLWVAAIVPVASATCRRLARQSTKLVTTVGAIAEYRARFSFVAKPAWTTSRSGRQAAIRSKLTSSPASR